MSPIDEARARLAAAERELAAARLRLLMAERQVRRVQAELALERR